MSAHNHNQSLLPGGFVDLLPPDAAQESGAIETLMTFFSGFGYKRVKPPLVEFEDSLFAPGPGAALPQKTFRVLDPGSYRMMGIRSDLTGQISRIAGSRLSGAPRPLRLSYAGDVLRTGSSQDRTERQFCKAGCEMIGIDDEQADIEICMLALGGLAALGITDITLDLALPDLIDHVLAPHTPDDAQYKTIRSALDHRDIGTLATLPDQDLSRLLQNIVRAAGTADTAITALEALALPGTVLNNLSRLKNVYLGVARAAEEIGIKDLQITIDPVERKGHDYHHGLGFTIFGRHMRGALGRGGGYSVMTGNTNEDREPATGFTLYMDTVRKALPAQEKEQKTIYVLSSHAWSDIMTLHQDGWTVIRGRAGDPVPPSCTHIYEDGQIIKHV